jgi:hypothetical protein
MLRRQLSLYVPQREARPLEEIRKRIDPIQQALIPAHVTLCREDELGSLEIIRGRLRHITRWPLKMCFGRPEVVESHGMLLNCVEGAVEFQRLREEVLGSSSIFALRPHLTLAHPRNPRASGNSLEALRLLPAEISVRFYSIHLIEQVHGAPWQVLETFEPTKA